MNAAKDPGEYIEHIGEYHEGSLTGTGERAPRSRYYDTSSPDGPKVLGGYAGDHGPVAPGDLVIYANPAAALPDPGLMRVEEIIDFGGGHPPQAILTVMATAETWEVSAANLVPARPVDGILARDPDLRLSLILILARALAGAGFTLSGEYGVLPGALAEHVLAQDGDLRNNCALPTPWASDLTARDDDRTIEDVGMPPDPFGQGVPDAAFAAWVRDSADVLRQAIFDAWEHRNEHDLPTIPDREYEGLGDQLAALLGDTGQDQ